MKDYKDMPDYQGELKRWEANSNMEAVTCFFAGGMITLMVVVAVLW